LHDRAECDALFFGEPFELPRLVFGEMRGAGAVARRRSTHFHCYREECRLVDMTQALAPKVFGGGDITAGEPGNVVAVASDGTRLLAGDAGRWLCARSGAELRVTLENFAEEKGATPAIEQKVMTGPDEVMAVLAEANEKDALKGRRVERKPASVLLSTKLVDGRPLVGQVGTFELVEGEGDFFENDLDWVRESLPHECGSQNGVAVDNRLPCGEKPLAIEALDADVQLGDVDWGLGGGQRMEEHALLERREGVDVLDETRMERKQLQVFDGKGGEGKIGRRNAHRLITEAVLDERNELIEVGIGERLDSIAAEHRPREGPTHLERAVEDLSVDFEPISERRIG
jgi:hypothetical protein